MCYNKQMQGKTIAFVACSDIPMNVHVSIQQLVKLFKHHQCVVDDYFPLNKFSSGLEKANHFNYMMQKNYDYMFDISGGDSSMNTLMYLDFSIIQSSKSIYVGYSDNTTIINAIYQKCAKHSYLFSVMNLLKKEEIDDFFKDKLFLADEDVVGGNLRCFLKLANTHYIPDLKGKRLLIEGLNTTFENFKSYLLELEKLKGFNQLKAILVGRFTRLEHQLLLDLLRQRYQVPIISYQQIGHHNDSLMQRIG